LIANSLNIKKKESERVPFFVLFVSLKIFRIFALNFDNQIITILFPTSPEP